MSPGIFALASVSSSRLAGAWYRIFSGEEDGWTFQALERAVVGYGGPTLLVIGASDEGGRTATLGAYTATGWERRRGFYGGPDCFLYRLAPELGVCRPLPRVGTRGGNYMFLRSDASVAPYGGPAGGDGPARGLGFGGALGSPRLFVDDSLETVTVSDRDTSFGPGDLGPPRSARDSLPGSRRAHRIDTLEVFAVGDASTVIAGLDARGTRRDAADAALRNARTVDRAAFLGDLREGGGKNFAHRGQVDGRAHGYLKGEDGKTNGL